MNLRELSETARELSPGDPLYPTRLLDLITPPLLLRVAGDWPLADKRVAIVGTRRASSRALDFSFELAADLARVGACVVSGGALGIDGAAHQGALDAGGQTAVVLPTGIADGYPHQHGELFERVANAGAILTEHPDGAPPFRGRFLERNRLIAALSDVVVVVQAPPRSGALNTADHAKRLGRPLLVVPSAPWDGRSKGGLALLKAGARICVDAADVLSIAASGGTERAATVAAESKQASDIQWLEGVDREVYQALGTRATDPERVARSTGIPISSVQASMVKLQLLGCVEARPRGRFRRCAPPKQS